MVMPNTLPLHLMLQMMQQHMRLASFPNGLPNWNSAWPSWNLNPNLSGALPNPADFTPLWNQVQHELDDAFAKFQHGLESLRAEPYARDAYAYEVLWQKGSATLYDCAPKAADAPAVLCIPSLINPSYILDLAPGRSLVQHLKAQGFRPLILDWGTPGDTELEFDCDSYITSYGLGALHALRDAHDGPIMLLGYCLGGIFSVAMAQLAPFYVDALALLATPWDFSADDTPVLLLQPATQFALRQCFAMGDTVPNHIIQSIFFMIDPWQAQSRYMDFPNLTPEEKTHFMAMEHWLNNGAPITKRAATECFIDWPQNNLLANHQWSVGRSWIEPSRITCPTFIATPQHDKIVPIGCAEPLATIIPNVARCSPSAGHVGMVAGSRAKTELWQPLSTFIHDLF
jgi:polyhydroxyalkanoate synthase subunit PhaC